jgi:heme-degrading monooxygenase HmoA
LRRATEAYSPECVEGDFSEVRTGLREVAICSSVDRFIARSVSERAEGGQQMEKTAQSYSSGQWSVRAGSEEEFLERWTTFIEWSSDNAEGAESFVLVRSTEEPRKFLSLGAWESQQAQEAWREMPRMQELLGQCRQLCEEFETHTHTLAASPSR